MTTKSISLEANLPVVRGIIDPDKTEWVQLTYKEKTVLIPYIEFGVERATVWSSLTRKGVTLVSKASRASVVEQVERIEKFTERLVFSRPGWHHGQFANASGQVFAPPKCRKGIVGFAPDTAKCATKGTHAEWLDQVARPLVGHHIPCFAMMACLAAPMLDLVGRTDNFGFELSGAGGKGKSTTQRIMASMVGPAMVKDRAYITSFNMTHAALEQSMRAHSDMPFIIDEANLFGAGSGGRADQRAMRDFSFQMGAGITKGRYGRHQQDGYRFVYVTSANEPFHELLSQAHRDTANAASDRLMSITIPEGDAGVFGDLPSGFATYRQFTLALEQGMSEQYGTAMPMFLRALVSARHKDGAKLIGRILRRVAEFNAHVGTNENNGSDVRVAEAFGLVYAAGRFAHFKGILPTEMDCLEAAAHCYANYRSTVPVRQTLPERLLAIAKREQTMTIDRTSLPSLSDEEMERIGAFIRVMKGGTLLLMTPRFGDLMFPDWRKLSKTSDFRALNKADKGARGRGYHCRVRANSKIDWFYAFKLPGEPDLPS